jgi:multiple sugar transport system substrate-binding protein
MKTIALKGMAWDHPRGYEPLIAASKEFEQEHPNVKITWHVRSLKEFGDMPIEDLIETYDFITIDHPYMGQADKNGLLLKLEEHISADTLHELKQQSLGRCFDIYQYNKHTYALPIDAAALVAAYRADKIKTLGLEIPKTKDQLVSFYKNLPTGFSVAWALCPTDIWCAFLSLCAQNAGGSFINDKTIDVEVGRTALDQIKYHLDYIHPMSLNWNPIQILDKMGDDNEIIYSPFLFGYTNYSRKGYTKNVVHFTNSPTGIHSNISTIMGGVGLAASALTKHPSIASKFLSFVADADVQKGVFTKHGGQPANKIAWESDANNVLCNGFFNDTMRTIKNAYIRPQHPGWNQFQEQGADIIHNGIAKDTNSQEIVKQLNQLYKSI